MKPALMCLTLTLLPFTAFAQDPAGPAWAPGLLTAEEAQEGFYPLFNGKDLEGGYIRGENKKAFYVKDGELVVSGDPGGDWLFTNNVYENFILRYDYKCGTKGEGNSGVAIRASADGNPAFSGMEIQVIRPGWETNYQRSGALYSTVPPGVAADKPRGEWNAVEVLCDGPRIRTIMNGQQLYDIKMTDYTETKDWQKKLTDRVKFGHIALQDHSDDVYFRNFRVKPLPSGEGWRPLMNGKDLTGWTPVGDAKWEMKDGVLHMNGAGSMQRSELRSVEEFDNFELRLSVRLGDHANSGVFFRGAGADPWPRTYEAQLDNHAPRQFIGAIWNQAKATELRATDNAWFQMEIRADGPHIQVRVNGKTVTDYTSPKHEQFKKGYLALQCHDAKCTASLGISRFACPRKQL